MKLSDNILWYLSFFVHNFSGKNNVDNIYTLPSVGSHKCRTDGILWDLKSDFLVICVVFFGNYTEIIFELSGLFSNISFFILHFVTF